MSKTTKRKHVAKEVLEEHVIPEGSQQIVRVVAGRGNNLHEVEALSGEKFLVSMPTKFRKSIWIKRGDYVIVEPIEEGDKVKAEIVHILYKHHIKYLKQEDLWPNEFNEDNGSSKTDRCGSDLCVNSAQRKSDADSGESDSSEDDNDDLFVNTNRPNVNLVDTDSSSSDSENVSNNGESDDGEDDVK